MPESNSSDLAWHYTTGENFELIVESGVLIPTGVGIAKKERPVLWFSLAQFWEPTASKGMMRDGQRVDAGMEGTYRLGRGLARFGISATKLVPWPKLARQANIPPRDRVILEKVARAKASEPAHWLGIIGRGLPLEDVEVIEVYDGKQWVGIEKAAKAGR